MRILNLTKQHLISTKKLTLVKGITWLTNELSDLFHFNTNDITLDKIQELKNENQEMKYMLSWLEEYSTITLTDTGKEKIQNDSKSQQILKEDNQISIKDIKSLIWPDFKTKLSSKYDDKLSPERNELYNDNHNQLLPSVYSSFEFLNIPESILKDFDSNNFNIFHLDSQVGKDNTLSIISLYIFSIYGFFNIVNYSKFENFVKEITKGYDRTNPYHNDIHAADVTHTAMLIINNSHIDKFANIDTVNLCALFLSCIIHDYKHPGVTNSFLINTNNPLALKYNDVSVLENYHIAQTFKLINSNPSCDFFSLMNKQQYKTIRKRMINSVLATDMVNRSHMLTFLKFMIEKYNIVKGVNAEKIFSDLNDEIAIFDMQQNFMNLVLLLSDISNATKPYDIYYLWTDRIMEELFIQGEKEKKIGMEISFVCDRIGTTKVQKQIDYIEGTICPFFTTVYEIFPGIGFMVENLKYNKEEVKKVKEKEIKRKMGK